MLASESPQSLSRKKSIFRRFSRRERNPNSPSPLASPLLVDEGFRPPKKLQRCLEEAPNLPTPPSSPEQHATTTIDPSKPRQPHMITHIRHVELPQNYQPVPHDSKLDSSTRPPLRVLPTAMPTKPFPGTPLIRPWDIFLPPTQIFSLYLGYLPEDMSDKWFIYSEGPDQAGRLKIHFHRSWTGMKIAELFVVVDVKGLGAGKIVGIKWNSSVETNQMNEDEAKYMVRMSCAWTVGVDLEE